MFHSIGQRKGLNIGGRADASEAPWYVYDKDLSTNQLKVCQGVNNELMYTNTLVASQLNWIKGSAPAEQFSACCKVRYRQPDQDCTIVLEGDKAVVHFNEPQRAITRGQSVVFYQGDICLGGGIIDDSWNEQ
jgi:tRNA-specific 2-thiouridylase